jgi:dolichol-phosphate mannosyltransferase
MRTLVCIPTYQEADNVDRFLRTVRTAAPDADILVCDDNSPDGTGDIADKTAAELGRVDVLHRPGKEGLGAAYREGFRWGLDHGYDVIVQMDCDFSHDPAVIDQLLAIMAEGVDCAIGSRYVPGGSTPGWPLHRRMLSKYGNRYTAAVLRLGIKDATGGFRAYANRTLEVIDIDSTRANGYAFQSEVALRMVEHHLKLREIPITFVDRQYGTSKMSVKIMVESMARVTSWGIKSRLSRRPSSVG